jgi:hypothetical protein
MTHGKEGKRQDVSRHSLEARLRSLPDVDPPKTLKARLLAAIPDTTRRRHHYPGWYPKAWDFGVTAAAAVLIIALMLMVNYGLSVPSHAQLLEDTALIAYPGWDQAFFSPDQNTGAEKFWPREHGSPMINQSERGH